MGYIVITDDLNAFDLKPSEKMTLGLIAGFTQEGQGLYYGSLSYLRSWLNCSENTAMSVLSRLVEKGLLIKGEIMVDGVRRCTYAPSKIAEGSLKNCGGTPSKIADNKKEYSKDITLIPIKGEGIVEALQAEFRAALEPFRGRYSDSMLEAFEAYWAAPLQRPTAKQKKDGILLLYQEQKTWDLGRRLVTWESRMDERLAQRPRNYYPQYGPRVNDRGETATVASMRSSRESLNTAALEALGGSRNDDSKLIGQ